jgi:hypothetical protein
MISNKEKRQIIESELKALERQKYQLEIACRVFKKTEQNQQLESRTATLIKTEQMIDEYKSELESISNEKADQSS